MVPGILPIQIVAGPNSLANKNVSWPHLLKQIPCCHFGVKQTFIAHSLDYDGVLSLYTSAQYGQHCM